MKVELPERHSDFPKFTVVVSGIASELSKTNVEVAATATMEELGQVDEQGGIVVHKDVVGIISRRIVAMEHRMERIERQLETLKSAFHGRISKLEDKMKTLLKVQQEILRKINDCDQIHPSLTSFANGHLSIERSLSAHAVTSIADHQSLERNRKKMWAKRKRMWDMRSLATSSMKVQITKGKRQMVVKPSVYYKSSVLKHYKKMRAKQAAKKELQVE